MGDDASSSDDEDEEEDGEAMDEDKPVGQTARGSRGPKQPPLPPIVDDEGFTVVQKGPRRR